MDLPLGKPGSCAAFCVLDHSRTRCLHVQPSIVTGVRSGHQITAQRQQSVQCWQICAKSLDCQPVQRSYGKQMVS